MSDIKTSWNLGLLYTDEADPAIIRDIEHIENACALFEKKYAKRIYTDSATNLATALKDFAALEKNLLAHKPWWYFALRTELNSEDSVSSATATKFEQRLTLAGNKITFFTLRIADIPKKQQAQFLKEKISLPPIKVQDELLEELDTCSVIKKSAQDLALLTEELEIGIANSK